MFTAREHGFWIAAVARPGAAALPLRDFYTPRPGVDVRYLYRDGQLDGDAFAAVSKREHV